MSLKANSAVAMSLSLLQTALYFNTSAKAQHTSANHINSQEQKKSISQSCTKEAQVTMIPLLKERKPIITTNNVVVQEGNTTKRQHGWKKYCNSFELSRHWSRIGRRASEMAAENLAQKRVEYEPCSFCPSWSFSLSSTQWQMKKLPMISNTAMQLSFPFGCRMCGKRL